MKSLAVRPGLPPHQRRSTLGRMRPPILLLPAAAFLLVGCSGLAQPFVDSRREAGTTEQVGLSTADRVAICYNSETTTPDALWALAEEQCARTGRRATFDSQDHLSCRLLMPSVAYFRCVAPLR